MVTWQICSPRFLPKGDTKGRLIVSHVIIITDNTGLNFTVWLVLRFDLFFPFYLCRMAAAVCSPPPPPRPTNTPPPPPKKKKKKKRRRRSKNTTWIIVVCRYENTQIAFVFFSSFCFVFCFGVFFYSFFGGWGWGGCE